MSFFGFFRRKSPPPATPPATPKPAVKAPPPDIFPAPETSTSETSTSETSTSETSTSETSTSETPTSEIAIRRYFHNEAGFQCYTTWFAHWGGWISAGHCVTEAHDHVPDFVRGDVTSWPDGLDAALAGCRLPAARPPAPVIGQDVILYGFPAGCRTLEQRTGRVYYERGGGAWICHIFEPDEPVVTGMSGGPVIDVRTGQPIGIIITRNSPADLNNDRDPDESADFIALSEVWDAMKAPKQV